MLYGKRHVRTESVRFPWMMQTDAYRKKRAGITLASGVSRDAGRLGARSTTWSIIDRCQNRRREYKQVRIARVVDTLSYAWPTCCYRFRVMYRYWIARGTVRKSLINYVTCLVNGYTVPVKSSGMLLPLSFATCLVFFLSILLREHLLLL